MKANIRYDSIVMDVEGTAGEVADLIFRLKSGGLANAKPVMRTETTDKPMPSREEIAAHLRSLPKSRHSVKGLMLHFLGTALSPRLAGKSSPEYLRFLARVKAAREDVEQAAKSSFVVEKDGKEVFYRLR